MALEVLREHATPELRLRWAEWPGNPDACALVVGLPDADGWTLGVVHRRDQPSHFDAAIEDMAAYERLEYMTRIVVAFGVPWERLTPELLVAQGRAFMSREGWGLELIEMPFEELVALRDVVGDEPESMIYALGARMAAREATTDSTAGPSWN